MIRNPFSTIFNKNKQAIVNARNLHISHKDSSQIGKWITGMETSNAKKKLESVIEKKMAVPYTKFNKDLPHKKGIAAGKYPVNAAKAFLNIINSAEKNAEFKGLDSKKLIIKYVSANKASSFYRPRRSRFRGQKRKNTNISLVVEERK